MMSAISASTDSTCARSGIRTPELVEDDSIGHERRAHDEGRAYSTQPFPSRNHGRAA